METPTSAIRDFLTAVDRGYLGAMPEGFNDSAFVKALREQASAPDMVAAEREACAKIADNYAETIKPYPWVKTASDVAELIRARST
jgi:hypothetical protein